jgi:hypothetical protein
MSLQRITLKDHCGMDQLGIGPAPLLPEYPAAVLGQRLPDELDIHLSAYG